MTDIRRLLNQIAAQEEQLRSTQFLAPCVRGGRVRAKVAGLVYEFQPKPRDFEGWGIFQVEANQKAALVEEASLPQVAEYLNLFQPFRMRLAYGLRGQTWLAYPINEADVRQRLGSAKPVPVHLVSDGLPFETVVVRWDGGAWWFDEVDRRADPTVSETLRGAIQQLILPGELRFSGLTPEMRSLYHLITQKTPAFQIKQREVTEEDRLRDALQMGGGQLQEFRDLADHWLINWTTADGEHHTSAISKTDLTVMSAGICLSGLDHTFDLQSLVGVVEGR